jgi:hypothetical protein
MHPELERCLALIADGTAGLDDQAAAIRIGGRWSVAEIVEHLDRTYSGTVKGLQRCLEAGAPRASAPSLKSRLRVGVVVSLGVFPRGIEAPRHVVPTGSVPLSEVTARVGVHLQALDATAATVLGRFGRGRVLDHPVLGPLTVGQWLRFHRIHTRHHWRQMVERRQRLHTAS